ncbi:MAG TPA: ABC transporter permease subunit [Mycobacteriales bacterium]|nr:ABC transporter permease subunit [Mycobacteriales bacterium]
MSAVIAVATWLTDGRNWHGVEGIPHRLAEHVTISAISVGVAVALALPVALTLGHLRRGGLVAIGLSNAARAVPSLALLVLSALVFGLDSNVPIVIAMVALAVPPIMTNAYVAVTDVAPGVVEAARGMGLSGWQVLARVEFPLALPMVMGAIRTAAVQVVATETLAAALAQGGLGRFILDGLSQNDVGKLVGGAVLVALLAVLTEAVFALAQRIVSPLDRAHRTDARSRRGMSGLPGVPETDHMEPVRPGIEM